MENKIQEKNIENEDTGSVDRRTGFWRRHASYFLEQIIYNVGFVGAVLVAALIVGASSSEVLNAVFGNSELYYGEVGLFSIIYLLISFLTVLVYLIINCYLYYKKGQSVGYKLFGLKIVDSETEEKPSKSKLFIRFAIKYLVPFSGVIIMSLALIVSMAAAEEITIFAIMTLFYVLIFGFVLADVGRIAFSKDKNAFHDKWAGVKVIDVKKVSSVWVWVLNLILPVLIMGLIIIVSVFALDQAIDDAQNSYQIQEEYLLDLGRLGRGEMTEDDFFGKYHSEEERLQIEAEFQRLQQEFENDAPVIELN